jgi:hypothetical protein
MGASQFRREPTPRLAHTSQEGIGSKISEEYSGGGKWVHCRYTHHGSGQKWDAPYLMK